MSDTPNPVQANAQAEVNPMYDGSKPVEPSIAEKALNPKVTPPDPALADADREFARKFAALSRKEQETRQREQELSDREAKIKELEEKYNVQNDLKKRLKYNPLKALEEEAGLKFEDLTKIAMNGDLTPEMKMELMRQELEQKFSTELNSLKNQYESAEAKKQEQATQAAKEGFVSEITDTVSTTRDESGNLKYELINANNASDLVYDVIEQHYNEHGEILDIEVAADEVESYLEEEVMKTLELNKVKSKLGPKPKSEESPAPGQGSMTLSNDFALESPKTKTKLSNDESLREAAKLIRWKE